MPHRVVHAAWLAAKYKYFGHHLVVGTTALAVLQFHRGGEEEVKRNLDRLAASFTPGPEYLAQWNDLIAEWPYLNEATRPLWSWTSGASRRRRMHLTDMATVLRDIDLPASNHLNQNDLVGLLHCEFVRMSTRRQRADLLRSRQGMEDMTKWREPVIFYPPDQEMVKALASGPRGVITEGANFTDVWCGSGTRAVGMAFAMRVLDRDPAKATWRLVSYDPMQVAMAAVNVTAAGLYNEARDNIHLEVSDVHAKQWILQHPHEAHEAMLQGQIPRELMPADLMRLVATMEAEDEREQLAQVTAILRGQQ